MVFVHSAEKRQRQLTEARETASEDRVWKGDLSVPSGSGAKILTNEFDRQDCARPTVLLFIFACCAASLTGCLSSESRLSETPLYSDIRSKTLADDVEFFQPKFQLWSDGVDKSRYIRLPPGMQIDTSDMNEWVFPIGTELYKEFSVDGQRLETRLQRKTANGVWAMTTYIWNEDQSDAEIAPLGSSNIQAASHDSPPFWDCTYCHGTPSKPLGFSAIQLEHELEGVNLSNLVDANRLTHRPQTSLAPPGDSLDQQILGAFHVNCGSCHSDRGELRNLPLRLALSTDALAQLRDTSLFQTAVNVEREEPIGGLSTFIAPGRPDQSLLHFRMSQRGNTAQMPPIGTEEVDLELLEALAIWIARLPATSAAEEE